MFNNHSLQQADDIQLLEELNKCFATDTEPISHQKPYNERSYLGELKNINNNPISSSSQFTKKNTLGSQPTLSELLNSQNGSDIYDSKEIWLKKIDHFYQLLDQLITIDQQIVYLKNIADRFGERKKCQCVHVQASTFKFSAWQYLPILDPLPSQQELRLSDLRLSSCIERSEQVWRGLLSSFTVRQGQTIFREIDFQNSGKIDIFDIIGQLQIRMQKKYQMKDVINLFKRLSKKDELTLDQFRTLFRK